MKQPLVRGEGVPCSLFLGKIDDDDTLDFDLTGVERLALGVGDGSFAFTSSPGRPDPMHAEYGWDIDCDAHRDVVGLIASTNVLKGWHGDGAGKFSPFPEELASGVHHMVVADVNADGEPDLVVAGETSIDILLGDVDSLFTSVKHLTQASKESEFTLVDLNGDGALDLVFLDEGTLFVAMNHI